MKGTWRPAPRYILRKQCVLRLLRGLPPGRVLEIGCAQGDMLRTLGARGFSGLGVDLSAEAIDAAKAAVTEQLKERVTFEPPGGEEAAGPYDYVMSLDVLEHIEDDLAALRKWRQMLAPGGRLVLSVPAGMQRWGASDVAVGHYRRYSREGLTELLGRAGFRLEVCWCYGFPVANLSQYLTNRIHSRALEQVSQETMRTRSERSGIDRSAIRRFSWLWNNPIFRVGGGVQLLFRSLEWGNGYVLRARADNTADDDRQAVAGSDNT